MKQYCRYCAQASPIDNELCYCEVKNQIRNKAVCVVINHCKDFEFNEIDVFDIDKVYHPRQAKSVVDDMEQLNLLSGE